MSLHTLSVLLMPIGKIPKHGVDMTEGIARPGEATAQQTSISNLLGVLQERCLEPEQSDHPVEGLPRIQSTDTATRLYNTQQSLVVLCCIGQQHYAQPLKQTGPPAH